MIWPVLYMIVLGAAAGFVATRVMNAEMGLVPTVALGVVGALIGGLFLRFVVSMMGITAHVFGAVFGAILLIWLYRRFAAGGR